MINSAPQLSSSPSIQAFGKDVIREMLSGVSLSIAKPLLAIEMKRIIPTVAGLPLEISLYTAAVAAAAVRGETSTLESFSLFDFPKHFAIQWSQ